MSQAESLLHRQNPNLHTSDEVSGVVNYLRADGESIPDEPADIGGVAIAAAAELLETPEVDVQQLESERKRSAAENLRALKNRFGERFVKGDLMEGGGYTGGAARELLAGFMDRPGFADELKRVIPGKRGALALLKDNHAYIQATLEQRYKDDPTRERTPAKDPYELARSVGYELTGPFASTSEFVPLDRQDFRPSERLCTFNSPTERLRGYNILWLRHAEVDGTLPADELTVDTLSDGWKTYLKTIGRYDQASDSYNLADLRPARDDPYGTSSMSVQISRQGTHVSIKNRYNHTVGNPDNTLDSDLDNVAYGLKRAVYTQVGREDLMDKTRVALAEGYIADNDGGIHHYQYEEDNIYYGDYEYIENGVVTTIDRGKYVCVSPQLYVPKSGKGDELRLGQRSAGLSGLEVCEDVRFLHKSSIKSNEKEPSIAELRQEYAKRDHAELKILAFERIREQFASSAVAYETIMNQIGAEGALDRQELQKLYDEQIEQWQRRGVLDYVAERIISHGELHTPIAKPNIILNPSKIKDLARQFGEDQPHETFIYEHLYDQYSAEELCGGVGSGPVRFSLIPSKFSPDEELGRQRVDIQQNILAGLRRDRPNLNYRVPSVLEALVHWQTLRAGGDKLNDNSAFEKTIIRHLDLEAKTVDGWLRVPRSFVDDDGKPDLSNSSVARDDDARVAVG